MRKGLKNTFSLLLAGIMGCTFELAHLSQTRSKRRSERRSCGMIGPMWDLEGGTGVDFHSHPIPLLQKKCYSVPVPDHSKKKKSPVPSR